MVFEKWAKTHKKQNSSRLTLTLTLTLTVYMQVDTNLTTTHKKVRDSSYNRPFRFVSLLLTLDTRKNDGRQCQCLSSFEFW